MTTATTNTRTRPATARPSTLRAETDWLAASRETFGEARTLAGTTARIAARLTGRLVLILLRLLVVVLWCAWYTPALLRALVVWRHVMARAPASARYA